MGQRSTSVLNHGRSQATRRRPELVSSAAAISAPRAASTNPASEKPLSEMLTIADAMTISRLGKTAIYAAASKGAFPLKKFGRRTLIPRAAFMAFLHGLPDAETRKTAA